MTSKWLLLVVLKFIITANYCTCSEFDSSEISDILWSIINSEEDLSKDSLFIPYKDVSEEENIFPASYAFACLSPGIFPGSDCFSYYRCTSDLTSYYFVCPGGTYFDPLLLKCTATEPAACISTSTAATTTAETTTISPTETTAVMTTTSSTVTSTTVPSTPSSIICTSPGIFAVGDCLSYYRCTDDLVAYEFQCPAGSFFDAVLLKCTAGSTASCSTESTSSSSAQTTLSPGTMAP